MGEIIDFPKTFDNDNKKLIIELTNRLAKVELAYAILEGRNKELTDNIS